MKLGSETGSVINHFQSRATIGQPKPVVGMGATLLFWTDRQAASIVSVEEIISKRYRYIVGVQEDRSRVVSGSTYDGSAEWAFERNPENVVRLFASRVDGGQWVSVQRNDKGRLVKMDGVGLRIGERDTYRDPSF